MKQLITAIALSVAVAGVFAADAASAPAKKLTPQQQKMADCSAANKGKTGDDYKSSQKACLSGTAAPAAAASTPMTQQQKMAACSKQNKGKKGDDYKNAQKACLAA